MAWLGSPRTARIYRAQNSRDLDTNKTPILRVGPNHAKFLFTRTPARAEPKVLRGAARRPPRRFARYASLTAGAGAWRAARRRSV